jgi:hypothetical protein
MDVSVGIAVFDVDGRKLQLPPGARLDCSTMTFFSGERASILRSPDSISPEELDRLADELGLTRPSAAADSL